MKKATILGEAFAASFLTLVLTACHRDTRRDAESAAATLAAATPTSTAMNATATARDGFLYGRITLNDGTAYEGRLRWGVDEEALWSNYFNGARAKNAWAALVPQDQLPREHQSIGFFGIELVGWQNKVNLGRPFMARFGDIARIEPRGRDLRVILKSGTVVHLDRYGADDMNDGVRVWDPSRGVVDISEWRIRSIEFLSNTQFGTVPDPLYGTVHTRQGDFTGLVQWDREQCLGSDVLHGRIAHGELRLRFDSIRSIARRSRSSVTVTLLDGRGIAMSGTRAVGQGNRGLYVDDPRYGRVLVSWDAFERVDFSPGGGAPGYHAYAPGRPLTGTVTTRSGRHLAGRLVYDLDESETTETLDAPSQGVDYTIPFSRIASILLPGREAHSAQRANVMLTTGEVLPLELSGDLGRWNGGMLIFLAGRQRPEYVPWADVQQVDFDDAPER